MGRHGDDGRPARRAALYCRVSTRDQSCERQERDLAAFAFEVVGVFKV